MHTTETWIFASEDPSHDADFHHHALGQIADYYWHGDGKVATAAARAAGCTPRLIVFSDGCAKQYKGKKHSDIWLKVFGTIGFLSSTTSQPLRTSKGAMMGSEVF